MNIKNEEHSSFEWDASEVPYGAEFSYLFVCCLSVVKIRRSVGAPEAYIANQY